MPPTSSPVPRLSSAPSDASTIHNIASRSPLRPLVSALRERDGRRLVRFWAMSSPPHRHRSTSNQQPQGSASTVCHPPRLVLFPHSGGDGRATSQPGREISSRSPLPTSPPFRGSSAYMRTPPKAGGQGAKYQCGGAVVLANQNSQDRPHKCIALNINYLFSPLGYAVQRQYIGEMVIVLKV